jgi:predicted acyltransferase
MRQKWIDVYRGIAVLFMVVLHFFVDIFPSKPISFLSYSIKGVITIGDMDLALFLFISGVSAYFSIFKVSERNRDAAIKRTLTRYSKIFLLGIFLDAVLILSTNLVWWVLEAIALSGILALFFICFSTTMKLVIIFVIGLCYTYIVSTPFMYGLVSIFPNGWIFGPVSLSGIVLLGYVIGEYITKKKEEALQSVVGAGLLLLIVGFVLGNFMMYDRGVGTLPYVLISSGFCMLLIVAIYWLVEMKKVGLSILADVGKSALLVFALNYLVLILAVRLNLNNKFNTERTALISLVIVLFFILVSKLYCKFNLGDRILGKQKF